MIGNYKSPTAGQRWRVCRPVLTMVSGAMGSLLLRRGGGRGWSGQQARVMVAYMPRTGIQDQPHRHRV